MLRVFTPITSVEQDMPLCNLGHLFNAYAARLSALEVSAAPQETLREYHRLAVPALKKLSKPDQARARALKAAQERLYVLALLDNSLHDMHNCVVAACNTLSDLFNLYDGDLRSYAIGERITQLAAYIPGDEEEMADYFTSEEWAEFQAEFEPVVGGNHFRVVYKDDEQSIAPYTITAQLAHFFAPLNEHTHIETIGSSFPEDFAYFTDVVTAYSEGHKTSHIGPGLGVYRVNEAGQARKLTYAERVESEVNEGVKDARVANHFNQILRRMHFASGLAVFLTDAASCRELLDVLLSIRDCTDLYEPATLA